jgi:hypothetical protein
MKIHILPHCKRLTVYRYKANEMRQYVYERCFTSYYSFFILVNLSHYQNNYSQCSFMLLLLLLQTQTAKS